MGKKKVEKDVISKILLAREEDWVEDRTKLQIYTTDGMMREFTDEQCCCERRYMTLNEDVEYFIGATYLGYDVSEFKRDTYDDEMIESQFLNIRTNKGVFTVVNHNEHNGYYGGFGVKMTHKPVNPTNGTELLEKIKKKK